MKNCLCLNLPLIFCLISLQFQKNGKSIVIFPGGLSEKAMKRMYTEYPHIHSIYLCLDNDELEMRDAGSLFSLIPEELSVYRLEPVKKDWNECLVAEVPVENMAKQMCWRDARENQFRS